MAQQVFDAMDSCLEFLGAAVNSAYITWHPAAPLQGSYSTLVENNRDRVHAST